MSEDTKALSDRADALFIALYAFGVAIGSIDNERGQALISNLYASSDVASTSGRQAVADELDRLAAMLGASSAQTWEHAH
jgi:hypothetical protein